eukprot:g5313.t1
MSRFDLENLTYEHEEQVKAFLKFFRSKRTVQLKELEACFEDQKEFLTDDMYSKDDVQKMLDSLLNSVVHTVETDLKNTVSMNMLVLRQLLEEAETEEIEMNIDMTIVEDQSLLTEVNKLAVDAPTKKDRRRKKVKLDGIRDEHQVMMREFEGVKADNKKLNRLNDELSDRLKASMKSEKKLKASLTSVRAQLDTLNRKMGVVEGGKSNAEDEYEKLKAELEETKAILKNQHGVDSEEARDAALDRVVQTKQFKEFRRQFQKKNDQIAALRERLSRYEAEGDEHDLEIHTQIAATKK